MTQQEAKQRENELNELLNPKYSDLVSHVDLINGTDKINIAFFWNKISSQKWKECKTYRINANDFQNILETQIIPFFL
jgi:hypothetical protein